MTKSKSAKQKYPDISHDTVSKALSALKEMNAAYFKEQKKKPLLEDQSQTPVFLQVHLKKIPRRGTQTIYISLPHSLHTKTTEACLITGDLEKLNKKAEIENTVVHYKELLQSKNVTVVNEVMPLRQLRTEYKTYESRRQLVSAYDVFLSDKKIFEVLPNLLGKAFYQKNKFPIQIDMNSSNLKAVIENALSKTSFLLTGHGNSCALKVGRMNLQMEKIVENVQQCIKDISSKLPGCPENISGLYLKTGKSKAIPLYVSFGNPNDIKLKLKRKKNKSVVGDLSTLPDDAEVKVFEDGRTLVSRSAASHLVSYFEDDGATNLDGMKKAFGLATAGGAKKKKNPKKRKAKKPVQSPAKKMKKSDGAPAACYEANSKSATPTLKKSVKSKTKKGKQSVDDTQQNVSCYEVSSEKKIKKKKRSKVED